MDRSGPPDVPAHFIERYEMAITAEDLRRLYRYIPGGEAARFDGSSAVLEETPSRGWRVALSNPRLRALGRMQFPLADIAVEAWGYGREEFDRFLDRVHLVFRRGGG